ncbi:MAG: class II aldolase/adducin family protein [Calditrichia bacterium]
MKTAIQQMIETGRRMYDKGLIAASEGNLSCRLSEKEILVTGSGVCKGELSAANLTVINPSGEPVQNGPRPSSELLLHLEVYRQRPEVSAVIHAHPPYVLALNLAGLAPDKPYLPESALLLGKVPTVPYARPSTPQVPRSIHTHIKKTDVLILDRHGSLTVGASLKEAYQKLEILEHTAKIIWLARQAGNPRLLDSGELAALERMRKSVYGLNYPVLPFKSETE